MARVKQYLEEDVLVMARKRIAHVFDTFDSIVVMFSGGKDSLVTLELVRQEAERRKQEKVHVVFRDEELIPNSVIDFVASYKAKPWCDLRWLVMPFRSDKFILGQHVEYVQWDSGRPWVRQPPDFAEVHNIGGQVMSQYDMDGWTAKPYPGKGGVHAGHPGE